MYQRWVRHIRTGQTGIVVQRPTDGCPNIVIAPDYNPQLTVCWPKGYCQVVK